ncbi:hypothetical protein Q0F98_18135 [Paenibacillus amylolyticus]|nr:hypothetical protein Q0F98_18135 [Paenibacillus amylolyticus]
MDNRAANETVELAPNHIVIVEGLHVLIDEHLRSLMDIKVFVDTDSDVRILRRVLQDIEERGRTIQSVYKQYLRNGKTDA